MTFLLVFVGCLFTVSALWLTIAPFVGADHGLRLEHLDEEVREIERLVARREVLLTGLRELDFDRETNKIATEDYEKFRRRYENEAVKIMRRLDEIHGGRDWQRRVDEELTERLGHEPQIRGATDEAPEDAPEAAPSDQSEAADNEPSEETEAEPSEAEPSDDDDETAVDTVVDLEDQARLRCRECDVPLASDDKFCSKCGTPVMAENADKGEEPVKSEASA